MITNDNKELFRKDDKGVNLATKITAHEDNGF